MNNILNPETYSWNFREENYGIANKKLYVQ